MPHLQRVAWKDRKGRADGFPFGIPAIRTLKDISVGPTVTLFVGENGSGKSTLLEAIAAAAGLPVVGAADTGADESLAAQRDLAQSLRLTWKYRTRRGFFLRAEDFFGFQKRLQREQRELKDRLAEIEVEYANAPDLARGLAAGPVAMSLGAIEGTYGKNPDGRSHGEAFLNLFKARLVPKGLFLLDEPEAALSPQSQLALLAMIFDTLGREGQFIIATHSPILLAFPGATIYSFDNAPIREVPYDELEHVKLTRDFLENPQRFLRALRDPG